MLLVVTSARNCFTILELRNFVWFALVWGGGGVAGLGEEVSILEDRNSENELAKDTGCYKMTFVNGNSRLTFSRLHCPILLKSS